MSTPDPHDVDNRANDPGHEPRRRVNSAGLLWILVLVGLIALGLWWYGKQTASMVPETPPIPEAPVAAQPQESPAPAATAERPARPATRPTTKPAAPVTRDPLPLASNRAPRYPAQALRSGVEGSVSVRIEVDASGVPTDVRVVQRSGERSRDLDRAVIGAARSWRFEPALRDGQAVAGAVILPVDFKRE